MWTGPARGVGLGAVAGTGAGEGAGGNAAAQPVQRTSVSAAKDAWRSDIDRNDSTERRAGKYAKTEAA